MRTMFPSFDSGARSSGNSFNGRSYADAPDVDGRVYFKSPKRIPEGEFVRVKVTEALDYDLIAEVE